MAIKLLILSMLLLLLPVIVGGIVADPDSGKLQDRSAVLFRWVGGQMVLWAGFQVICVPMILARRRFTEVVALYSGYAAAMVILAVAVEIRRRKRKQTQKGFGGFFQGKDRKTLLLWACAAALLLLQLVQAVRLTYADGDDAYYVAVSSITEKADTMYLTHAYTGGGTDVKVRYGLAPFSIWIAYLARVSGIRTVSVAHVVLPVVLILMTYAIYFLLGRRLLAGRERYLPLFMIFTELLVLFGDYSLYTAENFMLARSRQGKAALGNIIFPMLFLLLLMMIERLSEQKKNRAADWLLLCCTMTAGCLCSTMGTFLTVLPVALTGLCAAVCYRRWKTLLPVALCCVPCGVFALIYLVS